jgi:hypothetical protein
LKPCGAPRQSRGGKLTTPLKQDIPSGPSGPIIHMKKYLNKENVTALVIVFVGTVLAMAFGNTVIGWIRGAKNKVTGS